MHLDADFAVNVLGLDQVVTKKLQSAINVPTQSKPNNLYDAWNFLLNYVRSLPGCGQANHARKHLEFRIWSIQKTA